LLNLIGNAIKFTEKGGVTLTVRLEKSVAQNVQIYFGVKDTGIGIRAEAQKKLFQPYAQASAGIARQFGGTGLGLSISKKLVTAMGGDIHLESKAGQGSTFFFVLPFEQGSPEATTAVSPATTAAVATPENGLRPLQILVIDDNVINLQVAAGLLEKEGHTIATASNATTGIEMHMERTFDVILMDMEMPEVDGPAAARTIRGLSDKKAEIPIIAMTANTGREDVMRCLDSGMNDYCAKPIDPDALRALLIRYTKAEGIPKATSLPMVKARAPKKPGTKPVISPNADSVHYVRPDRIVPTEAAASTPATPPREGLFDPQTLDSLKSLGKEQFDELMKGFYEKTESLIETAEKSVEAKSVKALTACGHDLAGMTSNFGFTALGDVARRINRLGRDNASVQAMAPQVAQLRALYTESRAAAEAWVKQ